MREKSSDRELILTEGLSLDNYYRDNGLDFGCGDIFCLGCDDKLKILNEIIICLLCFCDSEGKSPLGQIMVIAPPGYGPELENLRARLCEGVAKGALRSPLAADERDRFRFIELPDLRSSSVLATVADVPAKSAVIVHDAAAFRDGDVELEADRPSLREDFWVPQVRYLCSGLLAATREMDAYVVLSTGELGPRRPAHTETLKSLDNVGVLVGELVGDMDAILGDHLDRWDQLIAAGRIGGVIREIDCLDCGADEKAFLRIQVFHRGGLYGQALEEIERFPIDSGVPLVLTKLARIASDADATFLSARFLGAAIDTLNSVEGLALAVDTAFNLSEPELEARAAARLEQLFPGHPALIERNWRLLSRTGDYSELSALAESQGQIRTRDLFKELSALLPKQGVPDYALIEASLLKRYEDQLQQIILILARDARRRQLPIHALEIATRRAIASSKTARLVLNVIEDLALDHDVAGQLRVPAEQLQSAIASVIEYLAQNTTDARTRTRLVHVLSLDVTGTLGLALVATIALDFMRRPINIVKNAHTEISSTDELSAKLDVIKEAFKWLSKESPVALERIVLPKELITEPADELASYVMRMIQYLSGEIRDDADINQMLIWVGLGIGINPYTETRDHDLPMIRVAATAFATAGRVQLARDLAEQALRMGANSSARMRVSWFAMADIYQRLGNQLESLIAFACAAAGDATLDGEEAWNETNGLVRLLRDLGLFAIARQIHVKGGEILRRMGLAQANAHRHRFMSLTIDVRDATRNPEGLDSKLPNLLERATESAQEALDRRDAVDPSAMMLGQLILWSSLANLDVPQATIDVFNQLLEKASGPVAELVRTFAAIQPDVDGILRLHQSIERARYASDGGFDARFTAMAAHRLLATEATREDAIAATFAIEMLSDRAIPPPGWQVTPKPLPALKSVGDTANIARNLSMEGISVVLLGIDSEQILTRVDWAAGSERVFTESVDVFSVPEFRTWKEEFPYRYGVDETTPNLFYTTTEQLRFRSLPEGAVVIVADAELQQLPSNIIRIDEEFAGQGRPMASAPSLSWLKAARDNPPETNGRAVAWISQEEKLGATFVTIATRTSEALGKHGIEIDTGAVIPGNLAESELVIVAAHGGLGLDGKFFQRVSDEGDLVATGRELAASLRNVGVVILFICNGGRADKVPDAVTTAGLAKAILDQGCSAVVASHWPLNSMVTYQWLPTFLDTWMAGKSLVEANFLANQHVARELGAEPAKALAMNVYGDPLRRYRGRGQA